MAGCKIKILVVEDEADIRRFLRASFAAHGHQLIESETGYDGMKQLAAQRPDLVLLDLGLPDIDGLDVIRQVRSWSQVPIIVLSARGREADKVDALRIGADDYLTKPFGIGELLARMQVALRHAARGRDEPGEPVFVQENVRVDLERRRVFVAGNEIHLTPIEYRILTTLIKWPGRVITHRHLFEEVWGPNRVFEVHYLRVYITHLRHKLESNPACPRLLLTEPGVGYRLAAPVQAALDG